VSDDRTEYLAEFGRPVRIVEIDRPMRSDDEETAQTIEMMRAIAEKDAADPAVRRAAAEALEDAGIDRYASPIDKASAVFWYLKRTITYVATPGTSPFVDQTLISPCAVLGMPEPIGDCPQFSMLACAIFRVLCMHSMYVTIAAEKTEPDTWSHVYNQVEIAPGVYLPFDSSNGPEPGAQYAKPFKRRVWPGLPKSTHCTNRKEAMVRTNYRGRAGSMRSRSLRGSLGDDAWDAGTSIDAPVAVPTPPDVFGAGGAGMVGVPGVITGSDSTFIYSTDSNGTQYSTPLESLFPSGSGGGSGSAAAPSSSGNLLNALLTDVGQIGTSLVKAAVTPKPYYITNAAGQQVLYNPATGGVVSTGLNLGSISPTIWVVAAAGLGALLLMGKK
jgi:hypothetical protein